ncbi:MAG: xanthine dehydrogenase family protein molybdopterin-binding subunit [Pseudomonadota bacterium]
MLGTITTEDIRRAIAAGTSSVAAPLKSSVDRRVFLKVASLGAAGFAIGCSEEPGAPRKSKQAPAETAEEAGPPTFPMNAFVRVGADDSVTVVIKHLDKGQGVTTGLTTIVAEEMDADWSQMRWEYAPADAATYANTAFGVQGTGGSTSIAVSWEQLRKAGAAAKAMLIAAAAAAWDVAPAEIGVASGKLIHASGKEASFGEFAERAGAMEPPAEPTLKSPQNFKLIGSDLPRIDSPEKTTGEAQYTIDVERPGMLHAVVAHPPKFGGKVASFDAKAAKKVKGVVNVVEIPRGVAVLAKSFWAAKQGRDALAVEWDFSEAETRSTEQMFADFKERSKGEAATARSDGDVEAAFADADTIIQRTYEFPFLNHAQMEPLNAVVEMKDGAAEVWTASQLPTVDQQVTAQILGVAPEKVTIHTLSAGGSFGRRAVPDSDFVAEAAMIVKATGGKTPVKLQWTREDDMTSGRYRPISYHVMKGALNAEGDITAWSHRIVAPSFIKGSAFEALIQDGIDGTAVEGARGLPYAIANMNVDISIADMGVPLLWWRSVGHTQNGYATETFFDELAVAGGKDPAELRKTLLAEHPRHLGVLNKALSMAGKAPSGAGAGRGVAVHESFSSFVAQIADVTVADDGSYTVDKVYCAVDCGLAINPDVVKAQMEGGIGFGLGAIMREEITLAEGEPQQSNYDAYLPLRMDEMPDVEVAIIPSSEAPTGVGEPGVPPIGPAVANALRDVTGRSITKLPIGDSVAV